MNLTIKPLNKSNLEMVNKNAKLKVNRHLSKKERADIKITQFTTDILIGLLLSDLHISLRSLNQNPRLFFAQSGKPEKFEFFMNVFKLLSEFCTKNLEPKTRIWKDKRTGEVYSSISFATLQLPCFKVLH
uniref:Homing endonuclease LAGLIDADG domain-containing protein n=1 Tax=Cantharellus lutescens TaxID=104198 RepID=A0A2U3TMN4_9AGAM|nr:hypothetical protein [Cantharellus lutescens]AWA82210.1 hypothetical protein [Cantharellus lutescens]